MPGQGWGKGIVREFGMDMYTLLYLKWITSKNLLYSTWNSALCYVAAWMRQGFEGEWIHVYVWLSPFAIHLKLSQHYLLTRYTLIKNKVFLKFFWLGTVTGITRLKCGFFLKSWNFESNYLTINVSILNRGIFLFYWF